MDELTGERLFKFGDEHTSDVVVSLRNKKRIPELFYLHSSILKGKSKYFAHRLFDPSSCSPIDIQCSEFDYDFHVQLLKLLYLPTDSLLQSLDSVQSALGILQVAFVLDCEPIVNSCIQYLEAVPWEDGEEDQILKVVPKLGPLAMPILARIQPVNFGATKDVYISAIHFATSVDNQCPPFRDELRTSAQEQVEYMLGDDDDMPFVAADDEVKRETRIGLTKIFSSFETEFSLLLGTDVTSMVLAENKIMCRLSDLEWMCNILPKMDLMKDFVAKWVEISINLLSILEDPKLESVMWGLKLKLVEVTSKVLDAVAYGNVILPASSRVVLLKSWLPYIRKVKPILDSLSNKDITFAYKMDEELCQSIEGTMVSLISALPSNDQAEILTDWMDTEQLRYPDLSEAFEVWCYRSKSAKRRLEEGLHSH